MCITLEHVFTKFKTKCHHAEHFELNCNYGVINCLFQVVGKTFDKLEKQHETQYFETIYALLDHLSPCYRRSFGDALASKLARLQEQQNMDQETD